MNNWAVWVLASSVLLALYDLAKKASVRENSVLPVLFCSTIFGSFAFMLGLLSCGRLATVWASLTPGIALLAVCKSMIVATSWVFTFRALKTLPITIATPIRASSPALVFVVAFLIYHEIPSVVQAIGMIAVFGGYFAFSWAGKHEGIDFLRNRAVWFAVGGAICSAGSSLYDKFVFQLQGAPVESVQFVFQFGLVACYALLLTAQRALRLPRDRFEWRWSIPLVGILLAGADWLYFTGLAIPEVPISVAALMRRFSVVITFFLGARVFHESNLRRKSIALAFVILGILLLSARAG